MLVEPSPTCASDPRYPVCASSLSPLTAVWPSYWGGLRPLCVCTSLLLTEHIAKTLPPSASKWSLPQCSCAFWSFPLRESQLVGGQLPRQPPPSPKQRPPTGKVPHRLLLPSATSQTHASKDHRWVGFEKLLFSSGAKSSFAASTTFGVVWGFTFFPTKERTAIRSLPYSFDAQPTVKSELVW